MRILTFARALVIFAINLIGATTSNAQSIGTVSTSVPGQGTWETALQARDIGNTGSTNAFYDTALNITWLRDANVNGQMDWNTAMSWANNLTVGGVGGWRLPTMTDPNAVWNYSNGGTAAGYNVATNSSEMASLYFSTLGNKSVRDINGNIQYGEVLTNTGNFQNFQSFVYWSGTAIPNLPSPGGAWMFYTQVGVQSYFPLGEPLYAMAVHSGDIGTVVTAVPEPETYAMLLAGLGLVGAVTRRRRGDASRGTPCES